LCGACGAVVIATAVEASDVAKRYVTEVEVCPHPQILPVVTVSLNLNTIPHHWKDQECMEL